MPQPNMDIAQWNNVVVVERSRLVRACLRYTGNADVAEDLAQETLIEAWRNRHKVIDRAGVQPWLYAIARNVCLRWQRQHGREQACLADAPPDTGGTPLIDAVPDAYDWEAELERDELAVLLDRALALLPPETRTLLVQRYIAESSHAEIAARLGLSENVVAVRLHRGKLAFRRVLETNLRADAAVYGLCDAATDGWQPTPLWCPLCGEARLVGRRATTTEPFELQCPHCHIAPGGMLIQSGLIDGDLFAGVKGWKAMYRRWYQAQYSQLQRAVRDGVMACDRCGCIVPIQRPLPPSVPPPHRGIRGIYGACDGCGSSWYSSLNGLVLHVPQLQPFWRDHPRMRVLPEQPIEVAGQPALLKRCESRDGRAWLDVLVARDTLALIDVHSGAQQ